MSKDFAAGFENYLNNQYIFTLIVLIQALFGSYGLVDTPQKIKLLYKNSIFRIFLLFSIAYTATNQVEVAVAGIVLLLFFIHSLRTPEERKKHKFI